MPSDETVQKAYDNLDFQRGVRAFLDSIPIASLYAMREGLREVDAVNGTVGIWENLMDAKTLFLTPNTESVYAMTWLDLKEMDRWSSKARPIRLGWPTMQYLEHRSIEGGKNQGDSHF